MKIQILLLHRKIDHISTFAEKKFLRVPKKRNIGKARKEGREGGEQC